MSEPAGLSPLSPPDPVHNLTLSSNGLLSGTPPAQGSYSFTVEADGNGGYAQRTFTFTVVGPLTLTVTPTSISNGEQGVSVSEDPSVTCIYCLNGGLLPPTAQIIAGSGGSAEFIAKSMASSLDRQTKPKDAKIRASSTATGDETHALRGRFPSPHLHHPLTPTNHYPSPPHDPLKISPRLLNSN
jgi:hypothetical protein